MGVDDIIVITRRPLCKGRALVDPTWRWLGVALWQVGDGHGHESAILDVIQLVVGDEVADAGQVRQLLGSGEVMLGQVGLAAGGGWGQQYEPGRLGCRGGRGGAGGAR